MNSYDINLLPKKSKNIADKLLYFMLYYFRYIIVITQIIVIGVFFFRFREDQKVIDLKERFRQRQQILAVTAPIVDEARQLSRQTAQVGNILDIQETFDNMLNTILGNIPSDVVLKSLSIDEEEIAMSGSATNVFTVRALHKRLSVTEGFETAEIDTVERITSSEYNFSITIPLASDE